MITRNRVRRTINKVFLKCKLINNLIIIFFPKHSSVTILSLQCCSLIKDWFTVVNVLLLVGDCDSFLVFYVEQGFPEPGTVFLVLVELSISRFKRSFSEIPFHNESIFRDNYANSIWNFQSFSVNLSVILTECSIDIYVIQYLHCIFFSKW